MEILGIDIHPHGGWNLRCNLLGALQSLLLTAALAMGLMACAGSPPVEKDFAAPLDPVPSITSVSPTSGVVGTPVTIIGANFGGAQGGSTVTFGGVPATSTSWGVGSIAVSVPAGAATGNVVVTVGGQASNGLNFTVTIPAPSITSVNPGSGVIGTPVAISGANFGATQGGSTITFGGVPAAPTSWGAASIVVSVPAGAVTGNVVVTVGGQASNAFGFTVTVPAPSITSVNPGSGSVGTPVTITGANFGGAQGGSSITFGGVPAAPTSWGVGGIVAPVPVGAATGNVVVTVGGQASNGFGFTVTVPAPSISNVSPGSGIVGTSVTITGANFGGAQGGSSITFGGVPAAPTSWGVASIVVSVPAGAVTGNVVVTVGGQASNAFGFTVTVPAPSISSVNPGSGIVGLPVTITGANFGGAQGGSTITFGGIQATPTSWTAGGIVAPVPGGAVTGNVVVTVGGQASNAFGFTVTVPAPSITSLNPSSGVIGAPVTISGANFGGAQGGSSITFGGVPGTPTSWGAASIVVPVPGGAVTGNVVVTVGGQASNGSSFTVTVPAPSIASVNPGSGAVGTSVTVSGVNFGATQGGSTITFGGVAAAPTSWGDGSIVAPVPTGAATGNIIVTVSGQASNGSSFTVTTTAPSITSVNPGSGTVGTSVMVSGVNFGATQGGSTITFGGVAAAPISWSDGSIVAPVPTGAATGNIIVTVSGQASNGSSFTVTTTAPSITSVNPGSGAVGTSVTVSGVNFGATQGGSTITFGGVAAAPISWSDGSIVAPVPAGAVTGNVVVTVGGQASNGFSFSVGQTMINWNSVEQIIDGFGASAIDAGQNSPVTMSSAEADLFFSTTGSNLGFSLLRVQIMPSVADCDAWNVSMGLATGVCIPSSNATTYQGELTVAQAAVARGVRVWASQYSPTAAFKSNGVFYQGGALLTNTSNYAAMGTTLASFVTLMASNGVPLYAVSIQNEPDINQNYPSCLWTAQQFHDVVPYVYSAFQAAGVGSTLLMIPEKSNWDFSYASTAMNDPTVAADIGILAGHAYGGSAIVAPTTYGKSVWQSEVSSQSGTYDPSMANALTWAAEIHSYLATANANAWVWWAFSSQVWLGDDNSDATLADFNGNPAKRAYVTGQWSKFVRPGWNRIDVTDASGMNITAFKNTGTGQFAVVVVNSGSSNTDTFTLNGFNATSVTPWITDATRSLVQQSDVAVSGGAFSYTIPAGSVMTFAGQAQ